MQCKLISDHVAAGCSDVTVDQKCVIFRSCSSQTEWRGGTVLWEAGGVS